jgi:hypothetical protein
MVGMIPVPVEASFIQYRQEDLSDMNQNSLETMRTLLENELIVEKLAELGLSSEEIFYRIDQLNPEERQIVLNQLEGVQSGGSARIHYFLMLLFWAFLEIMLTLD